MQEYTCSVCGTAVGTGIEGTQPTFWHCGVRSPQREEYVPDPRSVYADTRLSLAEREQKLSVMSHQLRTRIRKIEYKLAPTLYMTNKLLAEVRDMRAKQACLSVNPTKMKVTKDRATLLKVWHFVLSSDAVSHDREPPVLGIDTCREYAITYSIELPIWAQP